MAEHRTPKAAKEGLKRRRRRRPVHAISVVEDLQERVFELRKSGGDLKIRNSLERSVIAAALELLKENIRLNENPQTTDDGNTT